MKPSTSGSKPRRTVLTALAAVFPSLVSLLIQNGVPLGGAFHPRDDLTHELIYNRLIRETHLAQFTTDRFILEPWANISLHIGWTMVSMGVLYGLFVWCQFGTRERQRKISTFMAAIVPVVIAGLFLFTVCLSWYAFWMLRFAIGFNLYEFYTSMKENFNLQSSNGPHLMGIRVKSETLSHWNKTQITLKCCGFHSYTDWTRIERDVVPDSCCKIHEPGCGKNFLLENIYQRGCERKLTEHIK